MEPVPASAIDVFSHHLARDSETRMTLVIRTSERLDRDRMLAAISSVMDSEPILRSYLSHEGDWLWWHQDLGVVPGDVLSEHTNHDGDDERFCFGRFDLHRAPLWTINIAHGEEDTLAVSMAHAIGDGRALMQLVDRLLSAYLGIHQEEVRRTIPDRSLQPLIGRGRERTSRIQGPTALWPSLYDGPGGGDGRIAIRRVQAEEFERLRKGWRSGHEATVNDILLAALASALRDLTDSGDDAVVSATVDNRQYSKVPLPELANLSTNYAIMLGDIRELSMAEVVLKVKKEMDPLKSSGDLGGEDLELFNGLSTSSQVDAVIGMMYRSSEEGKALYFITNVGEIRFSGDIESALGISDAYMTYPGISPPTIGIVVSSHSGTLNLNLGCYDGLPLDRATALLDSIIHHLRSI